MRKFQSILLLGLCLVTFSAFRAEQEPTTWETNIDQAKTTAAASEKIILLSFQGSDWCNNCRRLEKILFDSEAFNAFAAEHLVLLKADFPMKKENRLSKEQTAHNETLAEQFNPDGTFPLVILLDKDGNKLGEMAYPKSSVEDYMKSLESFVK